MLAIPVFRDRVAPVLNWSKRVLIVSDEEPEASRGEELVFPSATGFEILRSLKQKGVHTVICGAISRELLCYAANLGIKILCGVSGPVLDVLCAYRGRQLEEPRFRLPGCRGQRQYRGGCPRVAQRDLRDEGLGGVPGTAAGSGRCGGPGRSWRSGGDSDLEPKAPGGFPGSDRQDFCLCPACGTEILHQRGIPCTQMRCPECDRPMVRK
jgi:predicted Fe-Mo cluster-binding NifX family protein